MSDALSIRHDASMDEYHARKNYEAAAKAYEDALGHMMKLAALAKDVLDDEQIKFTDDCLADIKGTFGAAVSSAREDMR